MTKKQHYMTENERNQLEGMLRAGKPVAWIARELGFCRQTIYNEIKRGTYLHTVKWWDEERYSAEKGQHVHRKAQENKGRPLKIGHDRNYADFLEHKILRDRFSPAAALAAARAAGHQTTVCVSTLYSYIDQGIFYQLTSSHLWEKPTRKPRKKQEGPKIAHEKLPSIEQRPQHIKDRKEFGHWEMDLVVGPQESRPCLLTLTERMSRKELIFKLPNRKALTIRKIFNRLERELPDFRNIFKSITTDNGSEFAAHLDITAGLRMKGLDDVTVYFADSYCSWQKGAVENVNKLIRQYIPKKSNFNDFSDNYIKNVAKKLNLRPEDSKSKCKTLS